MSTLASAPVARALPVQPIRLYRHAVSGHAHRVELFLSLLGLPFETVEVNLLAGAHRQPDFLARNPFGQIPVIEDGDVTLADSNAILVYLASRYTAATTAWLPRDPLGAAQVQRWLSVAAGPLANGPNAARLIQLFKSNKSSDDAVASAHALFALMEEQLTGSDFLVGASPSLADVANYSYTARAPEGLVSLVGYPQLRAWLARIEALPGFVPMLKTPVGLSA